MCDVFTSVISTPQYLSAFHLPSHALLNRSRTDVFTKTNLMKFNQLQLDMQSLSGMEVFAIHYFIFYTSLRFFAINL